jgi:hypothetical protein
MRLQRSLRTALASFAGALFFMAGAEAGAPQVKTQAPGYYRMMLGDFEITALSDGILDLKPGELLTNTTKSEVTKYLQRAYESAAVPTSVNAYLVNTGDKLVLIDTGAPPSCSGRRSATYWPTSPPPATSPSRSTRC